MGKDGQRPGHIEGSLHKAAFKSDDVLVRCQVSSVCLLLKSKDAKIRLQNLARLRSFRDRKAVAKGAAKAASKAKARAQKKSKKSKTADAMRQAWPVFLPHAMLQSLFSAGLIKNLTLAHDEYTFSDLMAFCISLSPKPEALNPQQPDVPQEWRS